MVSSCTATLLLLVGLVDEGLVDMRNDTTPCNGPLDECVQLLISSDGQLQMPGRDTLHLYQGQEDCISAASAKLGGPPEEVGESA